MTSSHADLLNSLFAGKGEMANLMRSHDWSNTPLGPVEQWPQSLRTTVSILLNSRYPMFTFWGPKLVKLYNDAYRPVLGATKHPLALGKPATETWVDIWDAIGPLVEQVITKGEATWSDNMLLLMHRSGYVEETYFTFSYSPIQDETGGVGGLFCACTETTQQVLGERRLRTLRDLAAQAGEAKTTETACQIAAKTLANNPSDLPFSLIYLFDEEGKTAHLAGITGLEPDTTASPSTIALSEVASSQSWPLSKVIHTNQLERVEDVIERFGPLCVASWEESPHTALILPVASPGQDSPTGLLITGISPRRALDDDYQGFLQLVAGQIATAITDARAYEIERKRAEALAEIDRAKTIFFNNVSHEFRTPLTLILAPLEDALSSLNDFDSSHLPRQQIKEQLQIAQRNGQRLLKLVNMLLDFARIEAGRIEAVYEPTDLATFTTDLASSFRSLIERAGLSLVVECPPLPTEVYVDREMWEKIVLNLLSNAFKFTLTGTITVRLQGYDDRIELIVQDTGIGIPANEIPHLFERFHRVKGAQGRSFEGSGIGLSLVQELIKLHQGTIQVTSQLGQGSCIHISLPTGFAHLPIDCLGTSRTLASTATGATAYVEEAWRWLPEENQVEGLGFIPAEILQEHPVTLPSLAGSGRVLVVDDNADMRNYIKRLLEQYYTVETASDGIAALNKIRHLKPDLVLTDVMMPNLDGFGLLRALRADPKTRELPIVLLSARAGEEARVEGLAAGADDYLIKPFSGRELIARVEANLKMAQLRQEAALREQNLRLVAEQAQQATEAAFARLTQLLETMSDAFVELDQDWRITYQNAAAERVNNGKSRSQVLGKTHWEEWPNSVGSQLEYQYRKAMAEKIPVHFEHHYYDPPRLDVWLEIHAYPSPERLGIFFRNITERKQAELAIREREEILKLFFKYVPSGIAMFDRQMCYLMASQRWIEDYNLSSVESLLGRSHYDLFPEISEQWKQIHQRCLAGATERCEADRFERADGRIQWIRWEVRPWYKLNQEVGGLIIFAEDITERRQAETALQENRLLLQRQLAEIETIYQSAPIGLNVLDTELRFVRINQRLAEMNGIAVEAHLGHTIREVLPELADTTEQLLLPILETGEPLLNVEIIGETPAQPGVERTWLEHFLPLKDGDRVIGINTVCEEITEQKRNEAQRQQAEDELRRAKEELEIRVAERTAELRQINATLYQSESTLRSFFDSSTLLMGIVELRDEHILYISSNQASVSFFNAHPEVTQNGATATMRAPQDAIQQQWIKYYRHSEQIQAPVRFEHFYDPSGEPRWLSVSVCLIAGNSKEFPRFSYIAEDITDRKRVEEALQDSEARYRAIVEDQTEMITRFSPNSTILFANGAYCRYFKLDQHEIVGKSYTPVIYEDDREAVAQLVQSMSADNPMVVIENRVINGQGEVRWTQWVNRMLFDAQRNLRELQSVGRDITELKQAEQALRESEERLQLALEASGDGIWDWNIATDEIYYNPQYFQMLGYEADELPQLVSTWEQLVHPEDMVWVKKILAEHFQDSAVRYEFDYRLRTKSGEWKWIADYGKVVAWDKQGNPSRMIGTHRDVNARKQIEASLKESDRRWRSLLDNVQLVVIGLNINGNIEYANPFFLELTGYRPEEVLGQHWFSSFISPGQKSSLEITFREVLEHNFHTHYQNPILTRSGDERMIAWSNTILRDGSGQAIGTISIGEDITERYKVERMKAEFISVVSHELRTPLTSMQAALSLLSEKIIDPNTPEGEMTIQIATEGTDRLVRLVNDILDLERLESGKVRLEKHLCNIAELVNTAAAQMQEMANQSEITLEVNPLPLQIQADDDRLLQVLTNLLSNAIKFSPNRSAIQLSVELRQFEDSQSVLLFTVRDEGRGIPADKLDSIFDRFHQVDASDSREKGGTGLGLAICRSIVQQHGGEIWVESIVGKGSTFYFTIPNNSTIPTDQPKSGKA